VTTEIFVPKDKASLTLSPPGMIYGTCVAAATRLTTFPRLFSLVDWQEQLILVVPYRIFVAVRAGDLYACGRAEKKKGLPNK